ncbi:MAG: sugar transferase [Thermoleophilia bacterium]
MKRLFDISVSIILLTVLSIPIVIIAILIKVTSKGPALYWSDRIGKDNVIFRMPKFRTMTADTPQIATHLLINGENYLTPIGGYLRKYSIDEIPQIFCIVKGNMSFVGPRPALYNQNDLIKLRTERGIQDLVPGLSGYAQINGRDEISIKQKVELDFEYMKKRSFVFDMRILLQTISSVARSKGVKLDGHNHPDSND